MPATFSKDMGELDNGNLNRYYDKVVEKSRQDTERRVVKVMPIIKKILQYINSRDSRFAKQPECIGSYWPGLKIEKADKFDINVDVLGCPKLSYGSFEKKFIGLNKNVDDPAPSGISDDLQIEWKPSPLPSAPPGHGYIHLDGCGMDDWIFDGVLIPFLVKRTFHHLLAEAIGMPGLRGRVKQSRLVSGSALTVHVMNERGRVIGDVDFAPTLKTNLEFPATWPKGNVEWPSREKIRAVLAKRTNDAPRKNFCWWTSYAQADHELCHDIDAPDGGCRKQCLRMMKKMKSDIWCSTSKAVITSYHLKNTLWWECQERPHSWNIERVAFNFMSLVRRLHGYVKERHLPLYFNPDVNLFLEISAEDLKEVQRNLEEFLQNPSYFIQAALSEV